MGKSLTFGLISTISIKGICRDNVANDCFCSWFLVGLVVWGFLLVFHLSVLQLVLLSWVSQQLRCPLDPAGPLGAAFNGSFLCGHKTLLSCGI